MKKLFAAFMAVSVLVILSLTVLAAEPKLTLDMPKNICADDEMVIKASLSDCPKATSFGISVDFSDSFELLSAKILKDKESITDFDLKNKKGVFGSTVGETDINGDVLEITLKALKKSDSDEKVIVGITAKNGTNEIFNQSVSEKVTIGASTHKWSEWKTEKEANCTESGSERRECAECNKIEIREIPALGHDLTDIELLQAPTIYSTGLNKGTCKRCGIETEQSIPCTFIDPVTGIKLETKVGVFDDWTVITVDTVNSADERYASAKSLLADISDKFVLYNISAAVDGKETKMYGKASITFNVPEAYKGNEALYFIDKDGKLTECTDAVKSDGKITVERDVLGQYVVVNKGAANPEPVPQKDNGKIFIICGIVAVVVIALGAVYFIKRKK